MDDKLPQSYRGVRPAHIIEVCEGNGTQESPYEIVEYVVAYESFGGISRLTTLGKIQQLSDNERSFFN